MRKNALLIVAWMLCSQLMAMPRTKSQMKAIAAQAINQNMPLQEVRTMDHLTVFANSDGSFAIVSGDDRQPALLGMGLSPQHGSEVYSSNPEFDWYLEVANAALASGKPLKRVAPNPDKYPTRVDNLLTTTWSQNEPYKNHTPRMPNGDNYVTGCVATSMAQVLAYHRLPLHGTGEASVTSPLGERLVANFGQTLYDWDRMKPSYDHIAQDYTYEEGEAVAVLMAHCGVACRMSYNETGSGATNDDAAEGLRQYFGFKQARNVRRSSYSSDESWMNLIFEELSHRAPIMFGAQSTYGHSFVFSGYREDGMVYVNWGWGGDKNGWFDVNVLDPDQNGGFVTNQQMIIGIRAYQPDVWEHTVVLSQPGTLASQLDPSLTYGTLKVVGPMNEADLAHLRQRINTATITNYPNAADTYAVDLSEATFADDALPAMAFYGCTNLRYLTLPTTLTSIGVGAFGGCMALTKIENYSTDGSLVLTDGGTHLLAVLAGAQGDLRLPEGITHIDDHALTSLFAVTKVDMPASLTNIGKSVFASGSLLQQLWMRPDTRPTLADRNVYSPIATQTFLYVHAANRQIYRVSPYTSFAGTRLFGTLIKATSTVRPYGEENPTFGYTIEGDAVTGEPELLCEATPLSPPGTYPIFCRQGTVVGNDVVYQDGSLIVTESASITTPQHPSPNTQHPASNTPCYNLSGQRVSTETGNRPKGIYIQGKKKRIQQ